MSHTSGPWKYEESTKTIRSDPENYWIATMDSFDGAVDNNANAHLIALCPDMYDALQTIAGMKIDKNTEHKQLSALCIAIAKTAISKTACK